MDINQVILDTLDSAGEPLRPGEIADRVGLDKKDVDKAIKVLKKEEKIMSPKRCYYAPSK